MRTTGWLGLTTVALIAGWAVWMQSRPGPRSEPIAPMPANATPAGSSATLEVPLPAARVETADEVPTALERSLLCLDGRNALPVPGVRLYASEQTLAGPSGADGVIAFGALPRAEITVWGLGWVPFQLRRGAELPETVRLERADAELDVRLENDVLEQRVVRSLLQPHERHATGSAPWDAVLTERGAGRWVAADLPAGEYDVYLWITDPDGTVKPLSALRTQVAPGQRTVVRLDASAPAPVEEDH